MRMNRASRRAADMTMSREDRFQTERGKQRAMREKQWFDRQLKPFFKERCDKHVPKWATYVSRKCGQFSNIMRKIIGHLPPLFLPQILMAQKTAYIISPIPRIMAYLITTIVGVVGLALSPIALVLDCVLLVPAEWLRSFFGRFGLSFQIRQTDPNGNNYRLTIKKWWKIIDVSTWDI